MSLDGRVRIRTDAIDWLQEETLLMALIEIANRQS